MPTESSPEGAIVNSQWRKPLEITAEACLQPQRGDSAGNDYPRTHETFLKVADDRRGNYGDITIRYITNCRPRSMPQSFASLHIHVVFSTKRRERWLGEEFNPRLFEYIGGILRAHSCPLVAAGGTEDHVHLLTSLSRTKSVADVVRLVKANSSGWIHEALPAMELFQWQQGYGAFAVSASNLEAVKAYCENQAEHHHTRSFQDEFRELLRRHGLEWDERYVWD